VSGVPALRIHNTRRWALAWAALCAAFALHVVDEATHDFLWAVPDLVILT
jgi:hypothetical protein